MNDPQESGLVLSSHARVQSVQNNFLPFVLTDSKCGNARMNDPQESGLVLSSHARVQSVEINFLPFFDRFKWWKAFMLHRLRLEEQRKALGREREYAKNCPSWLELGKIPISDELLGATLTAQEDNGFRASPEGTQYAVLYRRWRLTMDTPDDQKVPPHDLKTCSDKGVAREKMS